MKQYGEFKIKNGLKSFVDSLERRTNATFSIRQQSLYSPPLRVYKIVEFFLYIDVLCLKTKPSRSTVTLIPYRTTPVPRNMTRYCQLTPNHQLSPCSPLPKYSRNG